VLAFEQPSWTSVGARDACRAREGASAPADRACAGVYVVRPANLLAHAYADDVRHECDGANAIGSWT
jgi:hypothetical protein